MHGSNKTSRLSKHLKSGRRRAATASRLLASAARNALETLESRQLMSMSAIAAPGGPYVVNEGASVVLDGSTSTPSTVSGSIVSYKWDLNYNGTSFSTTVTGRKVTYHPADNFATRQVALRVTDDQGEVDTVVTTLRADNVAPTIALSGDASVSEGASYALTWSATDPGRDKVSAWSVDWNDGSAPEAFAANATGGAHVFAEPGTYTISVSATDEDGTWVQTKTITVDPVTPAVIASGAPTVDEGQPYTVTFSVSEEEAEMWTIDWGDDTVDVITDPDATSATHVYTDNGNRVITVTAIDSDGDRGDATVAVMVGNVAPDATFHGTPALSVAEGTPIHQTLTVTDGGTDDTFTYAWSVTKDGEPYALAGGTVTNAADFNWTPGDEGEYVVTVVVTDDDGGECVRNSTAIAVTNAEPTGNISRSGGGGSVVEGTAVTLTANATDPGADDTTLTYAWGVTKNGLAYALPDGVVTDAQSFTFTPRDNGTYVAFCMVSDADGGEVSLQSAAIVATNSAPTATIGGAPANAAENSDIPLTADVVDAGADDTHTYQWTVEKGSVSAPTTGVDLSSGQYFFFPIDTYPPRATVTGSFRLNAPPVGDQTLLRIETDMDENLEVRYSTDGLALEFDGNRVNIPTSFTATDWNQVAVTVNNDTGAVELFLNGVSIHSTGPGFIDSHGGIYTVTATAQGLNAYLGQLANLKTFDSILSAEDIAKVAAGQAVSATPVNAYDFSGGTPGGGGWAISYPNRGSGTEPIYVSTVDTIAGPSFGGFSTVILPPGTVTNASTFHFVPPDNGTYRVKLTVTDDDGASVDAQTTDIVVTNVAPEATITGAPATSPEGTALSLSADVVDAVNDTHTYAWSVTKNGDPYALPGGVVTNAESFAFTPSDDGVYVISLTVTDDDGGVDTTTSTVTVENVAPAPTITDAPLAGTADEGVEIELGSSVVDPGADTVASYTWSVTKDGDAYTLPGGVVTNASTFAFTPGDQGEYVVKLVVVDSDGASGETTQTIDVANADPTATINGTPGGPVNENSAVSLSVAADDVDADVLSYAWSVTKNGVAYTLASGVATDGTSFSFTPNGVGSFIVTCVVTDEDGGSKTATTTAISVVDAPPAVTVTSPSAGYEGVPLTGTSTVVDGVDDTHTYQWSVEGVVSSNAFDLSNWGSARANVKSAGGSYTIGGWFKADNTGSSTLRLFGAMYEDSEGQYPAVGVAITGGSELSLVDGNGNYVPGLATLDEEWNHVAITVDDVTGNVTLFVNGVDVGSSGNGFANIPDDWFPVLGDENAGGVPAVADDFAVWNGVLADADLADVVAGTSALAKRYDVNFDVGLNVVFQVGSYVEREATNAGSVGGTWSAFGGAIAAGLGEIGTVTLPSGTVTNASSFTFTPPDNGTYRLKLVVTDQNSQSVTSYGPDIVVANIAPTVSVSDVSTGSEGTQISLTSSVDDVAADTLTYAWSVTKNGVAYGLGGTTADFSFTPDDDGEYVVSLVVTDKDGGVSSTASRTLAVENVAPTAAITGGPVGDIYEGTAVSVGSTVTDPGTDTFTRAWSVTKDGEPFTLPGGTDVSGSTFGFTPADEGAYVIKLVVTDSDGAVTTETRSVTVENANPVVTLAGEPVNPIVEGTAVSLTSSVTDLDSVEYAWSVTLDGEDYALPSGVATDGANLNFTPELDGDYVVTLVVTDEDGGSTTVHTGTIVVTNRPPAVTVHSPTTGTEGVALTGTSTVIDGPRDTHDYQWSLEKQATVSVGTPGIATFSSADGSYAASAWAPILPSYHSFAARLKIGALAAIGQEMTIISQGDYSDPSPFSDATAFTITRKDADTLTLALRIRSGNQTSSLTADVAASTVGDGFFSVALFHNDATGEATFFVNGTPLVDNGETINWGTNPGSATTYVGKNFDGEIDYLTVFLGELDGTTATHLHEGDPSGLMIWHSWDFNELPGAATAVGAGILLTDLTLSNVGLGGVGTGWTAATLPEGVIVDGTTLNFTPPDNGTYRLKLVVTDQGGATTTAYGDPIVVSNANPLVTLAQPADGVEGTPITFAATATDVAADTLSYAWTVTRNGVAYTLPSGVVTDASTLTFTPGDAGEYTATLTVTDEDGGLTQTGRTVDVANADPTASITGGPGGSLVEGATISLGSTAADAGNDPLTRAWTVTRNGVAYELPHGTVTDAASFEFVAGDDGTYVVTLTVTDDDEGSVTDTRTYVVANADPSATLTGGPSGTTYEGTPLTFGSTASDVAADTVTRAWSVTRNGVAYTLPGGTVTNAADFGFTPGDQGSYVVKLVVTDEDGGSKTLTQSFAVANAAPEGVVSLAPVGKVEGDTATFTVTATDAAGPSDTISYSWSVTKDGQAYALNAGTVANAATFSFVARDNGSYVATVVVSDEDGGSVSIHSTAFSVANVAPTTTLTGPAVAIRNLPATFVGGYEDPGVEDTHSFNWTYGDGSEQNGGLIRAHTYSAPGVYTVTQRIKDKDGATTTKSVTTDVRIAAVLSDPADPDRNALFIGGTAGNDSIKLNAVSGNRVKVMVNGETIGTFTVTGNIYVHAFDGNNSVTAQPGITNSVFVFAGDGKDTIVGGAGHDVIVAGGGQDVVYGGGGNDLLIGGNGADELWGEAGDDLIVNGTTSLDTEPYKLAAIGREWARTDASFAVRQAHVRGTLGGGLNEASQLNAASVFSDVSIDKLVGGEGRDWFFASMSGSAKDSVLDLASGETAAAA